MWASLLSPRLVALQKVSHLQGCQRERPLSILGAPEVNREPGVWFLNQTRESLPLADHSRFPATGYWTTLTYRSPTHLGIFIGTFTARSRLTLRLCIAPAYAYAHAIVYVYVHICRAYRPSACITYMYSACMHIACMHAVLVQVRAYILSCDIVASACERSDSLHALRLLEVWLFLSLPKISASRLVH